MAARKKAHRKATANRKPGKRKPAKAAARKAAPKAPAKKLVIGKGPIKKALSKSQVAGNISEETGLSRKDVKEVFNSLTRIMHRHLQNGAAGQFNLPGLLKCKVVRKPATKARKGINPFTGEPCVFKAKAARNVVKVRPLKGLKDMV